MTRMSTAFDSATSLTLVVALCALTAMPAAAQHPTTYSAATSPGGVSYLYRFDPETPYAAISLGRRLPPSLPESKEASYGLFAALIGQSADPAGSFEFGERMADLHASTSVITSRAEFSLVVKAPAPEIGRALKMAADAVATVEPRERPYKRLRAASERGLAESLLKPETIATRAAYTLALGDHPIVRLNSPSRYADTAHTDLSSWRKVAIGRDGLTIVASGRLTAAEAGTAIDAALSGWPVAPVTPTATKHTVSLAPQTIAVEQQTRQSIVALVGQPTYALGAEAELAGIGLAPATSGVEGRFAESVRVALGATYGVSTSITAVDRDQRLMVISMSVDTTKLSESIASLRKAYATWQQDGVSEREIAGHRTRFITSRAATYGDPAAANRLVLGTLLAERTLADIDGYAERIGKATPEAVNAVIKTKFPRAEDLLLVVVTPDAKAVAGTDCVIKTAVEVSSCRKK
jgi:predicted Zn-dependent peptidase